MTNFETFSNMECTWKNEGLHTDFHEPDWFNYDDQGMILPHSILGSIEDFRSYVEARGKTGLLKKIPNSGHLFGGSKNHKPNVVGNKRQVTPDAGTNALEHWNTHMKLRRRQQHNLSGVLRRPAEELLMNYGNRFRETQEKREMLDQVMPFVFSGYGHYVGGEFWRLPQRYGDEMSGIAATLTKTERGIREPSAQVGLPSSIRQESGLKSHPSWGWNQSIYLKQLCQNLGEVLQEVEYKKADMDKLEVIGSSKPFYTSICSDTSMEDQNQEEEPKDLHEDIVLQSNDVESESQGLPVPALKVSGKLANWTGNSCRNQEGIDTTILFEGPTGELQLSHLDLHNEGNTVIFYSWQQLPLPHHFPHLLPRSKRPHFYFNSCCGVILPGETQKIDLIFKSDTPGLQTELWQIHTHPVLLQGAPIQITLRGVALCQDKTADHRMYIENKLDKTVTLKICQSIVYEMVWGIHTPYRPSSPEEPQQTEEEEFLCKNPKICYKRKPVDDLKQLWYKVKPDSNWDLSVSTLRQAVLSLPDTETADDSLTQETGLAQLNSVLLPLYEPSPEIVSATATTVGQLLWRDSIDTFNIEAARLTCLLQQLNAFLDNDLSPSFGEERMDRRGASSKGESFRSKKETTMPVKTHETRKRGRESRSDLERPRRDRHSKESDLNLQKQASEDSTSDANKMDIYTRLLHQKVYGLMENLVETLCDVTDEWSRPSDEATDCNKENLK